jgi:MFS family permease
MSLVTEYVQRFRRFQRNARLFLISNVLSGVTVGILLVLYNLYLVSLGYHADFVGAVLFIGTIGAGLTIFPAGACVDRFSGKVILIYSTALIGVAGAGQILFRQPLPLLISAFVAGVGLAFLLVVTAPFLTANSSPEERPHLFSMNISLGLVTLVLGEVLGGALPTWFRSLPWLMAPLSPWASSLLASQPDPRSYQLALLFAGIIAAPSFIPLFMMSNDRPPSRRGGRGVEEGRGRLRRPAPDSLRSSPRRGGRGVEEGRGRFRRPAWWSLRRPLWGDISLSFTISRIKILLHSPFFSLVLVFLLTGLGAGLFIPYFNIYFVQHLNASPALFGLIDGGANAITALLTLTAPTLAKRIGKINTITLTRLASIPLLLTIGLTGILPLAALLYLVRQGAMDLSAGILQVYSMESVSEKHRGLANSSYQVAFQVPWALAAPLGGLIIVHFGYPPIFLLGAFFYILTIITLWARFGRRNSKKGESDLSLQIKFKV